MADFVVSLTRKGREIEAQQTLYGYGFKISSFVMGAGGHDPGNPNLALPLDLDVTELPGQFFWPEPIDVAELINPTCPRFTCILQPGEAVGGISNLGLIGVVEYVPVTSIYVIPTDVDISLDIINKTAHGFSDNDLLVYTTLGTAIGNLDPNPPLNTYYVINSTLNSFQLSATLGGSAIDLTSQGSIVHWFANNNSLPPGAPEVGSEFLYALTNFPLRTKVSSSRETYYVSLKT